MTAAITLTNGERITVTPGEAERVTDLLEHAEQSVIKVKPTRGQPWHIRPIDIASIGTT